MKVLFSLAKEAAFSEACDCLNERLHHFFPQYALLNPGEHIHDDCVVISLDGNSPLLDEGLVDAMVAAAIATGNTFHPVDHIPGTGPISVGRPGGPMMPYHSTRQPSYCTNFDVGRSNRRKVFRALLARVPDLATTSLLNILHFLESEQGVDLVVSYGENVQLQEYSVCPVCGDRGVDPVPLHSGTNHPITGFLTKNCSVYSQCLSCGLVFLRRQMPEDELWRYYSADQYAQLASTEEITTLYDNLSETNVSHLANYEAIRPLLTAARTGRVCDLGAGRGEFAAWAKKVNSQLHVTAVDWRFDEPVCEALTKEGIERISGDLNETVQSLQDFDFITAWEVIEHIKLETLPGLLKSIRNALAPGGRFVLSTPDFDDPFTRALDFWAMAPGEHISVFSRRSLEPILRAAGFRVTDEMHEAVTIKLADSWFAFGEGTNSHFSAKAEAGIINQFLKSDGLRSAFRNEVRMSNKGSEMILICEAN